MKNGGARPGAGRPKKFKQYEGGTGMLRVPVCLRDELSDYISSNGYRLPVYSQRVPLGPADEAIDEIERHLSLNELLPHPDKTLLHPMQGDSMEPRIMPGDLAVIDTSIEPLNNDVVLALVDGGLTLKRLKKLGRKVWLEADNPRYEPIELNPELENNIRGVMLYAISPISLNHVRRF